MSFYLRHKVHCCLEGFSYSCSLTWLCASASGWFLTVGLPTELYWAVLCLTGLQPPYLTLLLCSGLWPPGRLNCLSFDPAVTPPVGGVVLSQLQSQKRQEDRQSETEKEREKVRETDDRERELSGHTVGVTGLSIRTGPVGLAEMTWQGLICYMIWPPWLQQSLI